MNKTITKSICAVMIFITFLTGCAARPASNTASTTQQEAEAQLEKELGAFEITAHQRELAADNEAGYRVLDAGRGNPNWINTQSRYAFTRFMEFALGESERVMKDESMAGHAVKDGIGHRFDEAMNPAQSADSFLIKAVDYCVSNMGINKDDLIKEMVDGIIGDYYPSPSRCLRNTEKILNAYLESTLYHGENLAGSTTVFPTEGGTASMVYIFDALSHNRLLNPGDKIAIATPIFTPYLQIPSVKDYGMVSVDVTSSAENNWDISDDELKKLEDKSVKAFFLVNPSNPASHALSANTISKLKTVIEKNPDLIILTDDVYGTFVDDFQTVYSAIPHNTILVYSFSKLYGVTGWRIGLIAMNKDNVMDDLLKKQPEDVKNYLRGEYSIVTDDPDNMPFAERVVADSRSIGLYHTSGLSTPSQIYMDLLALTHLVYENDDPYIKLANNLVSERYKALMETLGLPEDDNDANAKYYTVVNIRSLCEKHYGKDFADWLYKNLTEIDFLNALAQKKGVVLMYGPGFNAPDGTVRISLANLNKEDYIELAKRMFELLDEYYNEFGGKSISSPAA